MRNSWMDVFYKPDYGIFVIFSNKLLHRKILSFRPQNVFTRPIERAITRQNRLRFNGALSICGFAITHTSRPDALVEW